MSVEERVSKVFVDGIGLEPGEVLLDASLKEDLGIDSTEMVEVMVALEKEFALKIPDGVIGGNSTVKDIVEFFSSRMIN